MHTISTIEKFARSVSESLANNHFVSLTLGHYKGTIEELKNIYIKRVRIKEKDKLSFTFRYQTKDIVKNYDFAEGVEEITKFLNSGFTFATAFTLDNDIILEERKGVYQIKNIKPTKSGLASLDHDNKKNIKIKPIGKSYLTELRITDEKGNVYKTTQDKFKQINHYIEILSSLVKELPANEKINVVDMGSGKGYLTFALYDFLTTNLNLNASVKGVEFRSDLVKLCNTIAQKNKFNNLHFEEGTIENYAFDKIDILIALHACDTATDDAIAKGIKANARLIVVAPCCHKQIRKEIAKNKKQNEISFITQHGIFLERQAEMATDAIRALVLEYYGYKTKVFEFITDAHTPKNIMIVGEKTTKPKDDAILEKIKKAKDFFGIKEHYIENLTHISL